MKFLAYALVVVTMLTLGVGLIRSLSYPPLRPASEAVPVAVSTEAVERLAGAIRIATISHEDAARFDAAAFQTLHEYLQAQFPRAHSELRRETVAEHSLLYTWAGNDGSLKPILLAAHLDVVPVELGTEDEWQEEPFSGRVSDGFVWGRGAIDDKSAVVGILEAVETLLGEGFNPARTVYLAFGHDEEVGGMRGAREIAALLQRRGVQLEMVLDEGGALADGMVPDIVAPIALVGVVEKGYVTMELVAGAPGGHSSLPPLQSAIGVLAEAITRLQAEPMHARLAEPTRELLQRISPESPFLQRVALRNLWITMPLVVRVLERNPTTNAMVRTTAALTMFESGTKENLLPSRARAVVNFRIAPGDSVAAVQEHVARVIDDPSIEANVIGAFSAEPSRRSSTDSASFLALERTIRSIVPNAIVVPHLVAVATDARHYEALSNDVLRFLPVRLAPQDLERIHGANERLNIVDYERLIRLYRELILNVAG
jgi:carboxypeptidase PM20D1